ncbi:MAG: WD40 repeat domain-containing protein [Pyrinomonadaceae bacterium]|nr:WD40 repeat domain-containing protein [Pyrinomonadaceae bacterium]
MKYFWTIPLTFLIFCSVFGQNAQSVYKKKGRIGMPIAGDKFSYYRFVEGGKKAILVGEMGVATWDLENLKMLKYLPYNVQEYYPVGAKGMIYSLGILALVKESFVEIDPNGKWFAAIEGKKEERKVIARSLQTGEKIAELALPYPIKSISVEGDYFIASAKEKDNTKIGVWDSQTFAQKTVFSFDDYKWHRVVKNSGKILIGLGNSKFPWLSGIAQRSGNLALFDLQTGKLEKQFTAPNMLENDFFYEFQVTKDEKYLIARRDKRVFVWEINGDGSPKLEVAPTNPKSKAEISEIIDEKILTARVDNKLRVFNFADSPVRESTLPTFSEKGYSYFLKDHKDRILYAILSKNESVLFDLESGKIITLKANPPTENERIKDTSFIAKGKYWAVPKQNKADKSYRTELYNTETGKLDFEVPYELGSDTDLTTDGNYFYTEKLGGFYVWNRQANRYYQIRLKFSTTSCPSSNDTSYSPPCSSETSNDEHIKLSPDERYFVKFGKNETIVYEIETGKEVQQLFDPESVKYDKFSKIKDSGIWQLRFMQDGTLTTADSYHSNDNNEMNYCHNCRSFTFWEREND